MSCFRFLRERIDLTFKFKNNNHNYFDTFKYTHKHKHKHTKQIWYPCGSFKGDERSAALSKSYSEDGWLSGISKNQLDGGIAGSLYSDLDQLKETVIRAYPQLRKARSDMEFGYRLSYTGLPEDKAKIIHQVDPVENKGPLDGLKNIFK